MRSGESIKPNPYLGQSVLVWGLGRHGGGVAVVRYLVQSGARVTILDEASEDELAESKQRLADLTNIEYRFGITQTVSSKPGSHNRFETLPIDPSQFDLIVVNPAVPDSHATYRRLREVAASKLTSEIDLLLRELRGVPLVVVTGSNGKSSVCQWIVRLVQLLDSKKSVFLGGNFEPGLVPECPKNLLELITANGRPIDNGTGLCVLELSSFQLAGMTGTSLSPSVAAVTNVTPNHLDWHQSFDEYTNAKSRLFESVDIETGTLVLPAGHDDPIRKRWIDHSHAVCPDPGRGPVTWSQVDRANAATVAKILEALGYTVSDRSLSQTRPDVPHRQTVIAVIDGVTYIDDSAATSPEAVEALLKRYGNTTCSKLVVIAGGRNKGFDLNSFARMLAGYSASVATIGETASNLASRVAAHGSRVRSHRSLKQALRWAKKIVPAGGVVALSPGMASTDQFSDYRDRGHHFRQLLSNEE